MAETTRTDENLTPQPRSTEPTDRMELRGVRFFGRHGVAPEERATGQWYFVDMDLYLDLALAGVSDDLTQSVDYAEVCRRVMSLGRERVFYLVEALAEAIAEMVLTAFPVAKVRVRVVKTPPVGLVASLAPLGTLEAFAIDVVRSR